MRAFPPVEITLPWLEKDGELVTVRLMFWEASRDKMTHALRHLFASEAINEGVDVYTVDVCTLATPADLLGHEDPALTPRRHVHRGQGAVEKARRAIGKRYRPAA